MSLERPVSPNPYDLLPKVPSFNLASDDISEGATKPLAHVSDWVGGENHSPRAPLVGFPARDRRLRRHLLRPRRADYQWLLALGRGRPEQ